MPFPLEIQEHIIDSFSENKPKQELVHLRLICRAWIPRINSHFFRSISIKVTEGFSFLALLKSSIYNIGQHIKRLNFSKEIDDISSNSLPTFHQAMNHVSFKTYMADLPLRLPHLETLVLYSLDTSSIEWVPSFPSVKHFISRQSTIKSHQLLRLVETASIQSIQLLDSMVEAYTHTVSQELTRHYAVHIHPARNKEEKQSNRKLPILTRIKAYSTSFTHNRPPWMLESVLFPPTTKSNLNTAPSLSHLSLRVIRPDSLEAIKGILQSTSESLPMLTLGFGASGRRRARIGSVDNYIPCSVCNLTLVS